MAKKKKATKKKKGFTLIELLIVIAIIGILASIVLVSLSSAREKAKQAAFKSEVSGAVASMIVDCDSNAAPTPPADTNNVDWAAAFTDTDCGPTGAGTFEIAATPTSGVPATCTGATATNNGSVFTSCP